MSAVGPSPDPISGLVGRRWLDTVFLVGLAGVFFVNAVVAVVHPADFTGLITRSTVGRWLHLEHASWLAPSIALNDLVLGVAVLGAARLPRWRPVVFAWTGAWLLAVTVVKLTALGA
jgi:hypothetical protein